MSGWWKASCASVKSFSCQPAKTYDSKVAIIWMHLLTWHYLVHLSCLSLHLWITLVQTTVQARMTWNQSKVKPREVSSHPNQERLESLFFLQWIMADLVQREWGNNLLCSCNHPIFFFTFLSSSHSLDYAPHCITCLLTTVQENGNLTDLLSSHHWTITLAQMIIFGCKSLSEMTNPVHTYDKRMRSNLWVQFM